MPLKSLTTFGIGGVAEHFAVAKTIEDILELIALAQKNHWPITVLGGGSNVLIADEGITGLVIKNEISGINYEVFSDTVLVTAGSGVSFDHLVEDAVNKNYWGLENLSHIPGSVGATPIQNVGAYGVEVSALIEEVEVIDLRSGEIKILSNSDCQFGYRTSYFKTDEGQNYFISRVSFRLTKHGIPLINYKDLVNYFKGVKEPSIYDMRQAVITVRSKKFPNWREQGTAGSFFKNLIVSRAEADRLKALYPDLPVFNATKGQMKVSLSWFLDKVLNLKGVREGRVGTYKDHVLVMVNYGEATAAEMTAFADQISKTVFDKTETTIEWEVTKLS